MTLYEEMLEAKKKQEEIAETQTEQQVLSQTDSGKQTKECPYCGGEISINAKKCKYCGEWVTDKSEINGNPNTQPTSQVIVNQTEHESNGAGTAGFVVALVCVIFSWVPGVNFFLWLIGLLLSFIGMFKSPRGLAVAGFLISIIGIIIIISIFGAISAIFR